MGGVRVDSMFRGSRAPWGRSEDRWDRGKGKTDRENGIDTFSAVCLTAILDGKDAKELSA
jgi:hypothetical protein